MTLAFDSDFTDSKFAKFIKRLDQYKDDHGNNLYTKSLRLDRDYDDKWKGFTSEKAKTALIDFMRKNLKDWRDMFGSSCAYITVGPNCPAQIVDAINNGGLKAIVPDLPLVAVSKANENNLNPHKVSVVLLQASGNSGKTSNVYEAVVRATKILTDLGFLVFNSEKFYIHSSQDGSVKTNEDKNTEKQVATGNTQTTIKPVENKDTPPLYDYGLDFNINDITDPVEKAKLLDFLKQSYDTLTDKALKPTSDVGKKDVPNKDANIGDINKSKKAKKQSPDNNNPQQTKKQPTDLADPQNSLAQNSILGKNVDKKDEGQNTPNAGTFTNSISGQNTDAEADKAKTAQTENKAENGEGDKKDDDEGGVRPLTIIIIVLVVLAVLVILGVVYKKMKN